METDKLNQTFDMIRVTDVDLMISFEAPQEWQGNKDSRFELDVFAPEEQRYQAHLSFTLKKVEPPTSNWLAQVINSTYYQGQIGLNQYQLIEGFELVLDEKPAFLARYEWVAEEAGLHFSQVDTLVLASPVSFYEIHGFSLKELERKYIPLFIYMIHSIRFVPPASFQAET